jgi:hypothetical protein
MRRSTKLLLVVALLLAPAPALAQATVSAAPGPSPVSPPPLDPAATYFYAAPGASQSTGPVTLEEIRNLVAAGTLKADAWIWTNGMAAWARADSVPALADLFGAAQPELMPIPTPANATEQTIGLPHLSLVATEAERKKVAAVLGATLGILFHEFGHALIGEIGIPATGPEEDAADEFSALLLGTALKPANFEGEAPELLGFITSVAQYSTLLWHFDDRAGRIAGFTKPWYDEHSDSINRFRNTFCLIYGADPETQKELADWVEFPQASRDRCAYEYPRRYKAWETITEKFVRDPEDGTGLPGNARADAPGGKINLVFHESATATGQLLLPVFYESGIFGAFAQAMERGFVWPRDFTLEFADCGEANAFYDPDNIRIIMCWEGIEYFAGVVLDGNSIPRR